MVSAACSLAGRKLVSHVSVQGSTTVLLLPWSSMCQTVLKGFSTTFSLGLEYYKTALLSTSPLQHSKEQTFLVRTWSPHHRLRDCPTHMGKRSSSRDKQQGCTEQTKRFLALQECKSLQLNNKIVSMTGVISFLPHNAQDI